METQPRQLNKNGNRRGMFPDSRKNLELGRKPSGGGCILTVVGEVTATLSWHLLEAEESVLGSLILDWMQSEPEKVTRVLMALKPQHFFREKNKWVYEACLALWKEGWPIDQVTVANRLARDRKLEDIGGAAYLSYLIQQIATPINIDYHARIVMERYNERVWAGEYRGV